MSRKKPLEEMTIMDDLIFGNVMRQEEFCKPLLEEILNAKIKKIEYVHETLSAVPLFWPRAFVWMCTWRIQKTQSTTLMCRRRTSIISARGCATIRA